LVIGGLWFSGQLDEFGIATGAEREELEYQRQEAPAIVESQYDGGGG